MNALFDIINDKGETLAVYDAERDLGIILLKKVIEPATPNTSTITIPGSSKVYDMTNLLAGHPTYKERKITLTFAALVPAQKYGLAQSIVASALNGQKTRLSFSDDCAYYYEGRIAVKAMQSPSMGAAGEIVVEIMADPFKWEHEWRTIAEGANNNGLTETPIVIDTDGVFANVAKVRIETAERTLDEGHHVDVFKRSGYAIVATFHAEAPAEVDVWEFPPGSLYESVAVKADSAQGGYYNAYWKAGVL